MLFVILVDFQLKPGTAKQFRAIIDANAHASVRDEPGCLQFDVMEAEGEQGRILLYEVYTGRAAFDAHLKTEHFRIFSDASANMILRKLVTRCDLVCSGENVEASAGSERR
jgi:autoinducer 2-degrading protein